MKILVLSPGLFDKGGIARYMRFQIKALREHLGNESIIAMSLAGRDVGDLEEQFDVSWHGTVPYTKLTRVHFAGVALCYALKNLPDVILCGHLNMGPLALVVARICGARLVQNIYGRELWSSSRSSRAYALRNADQVISDCCNSSNWVISRGAVRGTPSVIWDCVDTRRYCPGAPDWLRLRRYGLLETKRFRLMFLGRIHSDTRYKGTERLLHLLWRLPEDLFEAVFCGTGDDLGHLRSEATRLGVADRVHFTGAIHEDDMPAAYRSADAFYLVSEVGVGMGEGIPLTPLEAMSCGIPVIVGDQDGSREIIDRSGGGICVSPGDVQSVIDYLNRLYSNRHMRLAECVAARRRAISAFGYERFAEKTVASVASAKHCMPEQSATEYM